MPARRFWHDSKMPTLQDDFNDLDNAYGNRPLAHQETAAALNCGKHDYRI